MKKPKLLIASKVLESKSGAAQMQSEAQKQLDDLLDPGRVFIQIMEKPDEKAWLIKINREYPKKEHYEVPGIMCLNRETELYYRDAFLLAGNIGKEVVNFGYMPYADCGYHYYLAESDFLYHWNHAASKLGFSKVKSVKFTNDPHYFEVRMQF